MSSLCTLNTTALVDLNKYMKYRLTRSKEKRGSAEKCCFIPQMSKYVLSLKGPCVEFGCTPCARHVSNKTFLRILRETSSPLMWPNMVGADVLTGIHDNMHQPVLTCSSNNIRMVGHKPQPFSQRNEANSHSEEHLDAQGPNIWDLERQDLLWMTIISPKTV